MATIIQLKRTFKELTADEKQETLSKGEAFYDGVNNNLYIGDGTSSIETLIDSKKAIGYLSGKDIIQKINNVQELGVEIDLSHTSGNLPVSRITGNFPGDRINGKVTSASQADIALKATEADYATSSNTANEATTATTADSANSLYNDDKLLITSKLRTSFTQGAVAFSSDSTGASAYNGDVIGEVLPKVNDAKNVTGRIFFLVK